MSGAKSVGLKSAGGTAPTRLRQIALVVKDLEEAKRQLTYVLGTEVVYQDPSVAQWGLANFLIPLGGEFIEVVTPIKDNTSAGRLLDKRGDGGYMLLMQTEDARKRRESIEAESLAKVIWGHDTGDVVCTQYHPSGIKGGIIPSLVSHAPTAANPTPLSTRFSPWHACGPDPKTYSAAMRRTAHLSLEGCALRLLPGDLGHEAAGRQWEDLFGVGRSRDMLAFTNARVGFVGGRDGESGGLVSVTVGVYGRGRLEGIWERARGEGLCGGSANGRGGWISMCGVRWFLVLTGGVEQGLSRGKL